MTRNLQHHTVLTRERELGLQSFCYSVAIGPTEGGGHVRYLMERVPIVSPISQRRLRYTLTAIAHADRS